jgi:hypothetical protein
MGGRHGEIESLNPSLAVGRSSLANDKRRTTNDVLVIQLPSILALSFAKHSGIQLRSSQNDNVVLFSVVHPPLQDESNLLISKHLQGDYKISTGMAVEISRSGLLSPHGPVVVEQFQTKNG